MDRSFVRLVGAEQLPQVNRGLRRELCMTGIDRLLKCSPRFAEICLMSIHWLSNLLIALLLERKAVANPLSMFRGGFESVYHGFGSGG